MNTTDQAFIRAYGSDIVPSNADEAARAAELTAVAMSSRELSDLLMLGMGAYTPLDGFMGHDDWRGSCVDMKLSNGTFWPIPITLSLRMATTRAVR